MLGSRMENVFGSHEVGEGEGWASLQGRGDRRMEVGM